MSDLPAKNFNLPLHQNAHYWISLYPVAGDIHASVMEELVAEGMQELDGQGLGLCAPRDWKPYWDKVYDVLKAAKITSKVCVIITPGDEPPLMRPEAGCKTPENIQLIAESLWLGDALLEDRIMCYLQPVVSAKDKIFGYESFARVRAANGSIIAGYEIIAASKALGIEYMVDRHLHVQAIKTFVSSEFNGFLFVNFFPGFIHRPSVYLEGLSETAKGYGIISKHIVLDFTKSEMPHDIAHLKSVCDYGRTRGYSIALDDIATVESAKKLLPEIHPDFVKIDMQLVQKIGETGIRETIRAIVEMAHAAASTVIAEGVETEEMFQALKQLGVDLFQGYYFSPPVPVEAALKHSAAG